MRGRAAGFKMRRYRPPSRKAALGKIVGGKRMSKQVRERLRDAVLEMVRGGTLIVNESWRVSAPIRVTKGLRPSTP